MYIFLSFFAEVHLYLLILEKLEKYEEALEVLRGNLGGTVFANIRIIKHDLVN